MTNKICILILFQLKNKIMKISKENRNRIIDVIISFLQDIKQHSSDMLSLETLRRVIEEDSEFYSDIDLKEFDFIVSKFCK